MAAGAIGATALAEPCDPRAVERWLSAELSAAVVGLGPIGVEYYEVTSLAATDAALADLAARVAERVDHPQYAVLEQAKRIRETGPIRTRRKVWYFDSSGWRVNEDRSESDAKAAASFSDSARDGDVTWSQSPGHFIVCDQPARYDKFNPAPFGPAEARVIGLLAFAGLDLDEGRLPEISGVEAPGRESDWSASLRYRNGVHVHVAGDWQSGTGRIRLLRVLGSPYSDAERGMEFKFGDHAYDSTLNRMVARVVDLPSHDGVFRTSYHDAKFFSIAELDRARLLAIPTPGVADHVRGVIRYRSMFDNRAAAGGVLRVLDDDGVVRGEAALPRADARVIPRWVGWVVLVLLVLGFVVVRRRGLHRAKEMIR